MINKKFGTYYPTIFGKFLLLFINTGISRGKLKKLFHNIWRKYLNENPVDLIYNGLKLRVRPFGNTIESNILFSSKTREKSELKIIKKFVNSNTLFLDIGANFGYYSLFVASFGARKCIGFEPNPVLIERMKENINLNKLSEKIVVAPFALGKNSKMVNLHISKFGLGSSSIVKNNSSLETIRVKQKSLKKALEELNEIKADIVKIDIEGFEDKVLFPYLSVLEKDYLPSLIIIEDNSADWDLNILNWLEKNHYKRAGKTRGNIFLVKN